MKLKDEVKLSFNGHNFDYLLLGFDMNG